MATHQATDTSAVPAPVAPVLAAAILLGLLLSLLILL
jgi:hypothetical protein